MKTLVAVIAVVALAAGSYAVQQEDRPGAQKHQDQQQGIKVFKASQAEWKQADKMPQGVMKAQVSESKTGGSIWLVKFPAGTRVPAQMAQGDKVIHVHQGSLEIGQGAASGQPGRGAQDQPGGRGQEQPGRGGEGQLGQAQTVSAGDVVKISANSSYWLQAKTETLALVIMDSKGDASGQGPSEDPENKVK